MALSNIITLDGLKEAKEQQIERDKCFSPIVAAAAWDQGSADWGERYCAISAVLCYIFLDAGVKKMQEIDPDAGSNI